MLTIFKLCQSTLLLELRIMNFEEFLEEKWTKSNRDEFLREMLDAECLIHR
jgi:hypothetical protein